MNIFFIGAIILALVWMRWEFVDARKALEIAAERFETAAEKFNEPELTDDDWHDLATAAREIRWGETEIGLHRLERFLDDLKPDWR